MCGRYTLATPMDDLVEVFDVGRVAFNELRPRFNIAPTQDVPAIIADEHGERRMGMMRWGLVPFWADDVRIGSRLINARAETAATKPAFRAAFKSRRCIVPMDGFYEWVKEGEGKTPHWIHRSGRQPFAVAGLWERWRESEGADPVVSFTLITTAATPSIQPLHHRMPLVLGQAGIGLWLAGDSDTEALQGLMASPPEAEFEAWPVRRDVNRPANDGPELVEPL